MANKGQGSTRSKVRPKIGDIIAIPLVGRVYAYGRIYQDASIGVYDYVSRGIADFTHIVRKREVFFCGFDDFEVRQGRWKVLGRIPPTTESDEWTPPAFIEDILQPGSYEIYHKGQMRPATPREVKGLQEQVFFSSEGLREELRHRFRARINRLRKL